MAKHEALFDLGQETGLPIRFAWAMLPTACDREGRFQWRPRTLKADILPHDLIEFSRVLDALTTRGFIVRYASGTGDFGVIPSFTRHQVINNRERESELPEPSIEAELDACGTREPREGHAGKAEGKGREGNKEQGPADESGGFRSVAEQIARRYPKRAKLAMGINTLTIMLTQIPAAKINAALDVWIERWERDETEARYIPFLENWVKSRPWEDDEISPPPAEDAPVKPKAPPPPAEEPPTSKATHGGGFEALQRMAQPGYWEELEGGARE
jgi:hypothetical protein